MKLVERAPTGEAILTREGDCCGGVPTVEILGTLPIYPPSPEGDDLGRRISWSGLDLATAAERMEISPAEVVGLIRGRLIPADPDGWAILLGKLGKVPK